MITVISFPEIAYQPLRHYLSSGEEAVVDALPAPKRPGWLASRYALKQTFRQYYKKTYGTDIAAKYISLKKNLNQKPQLEVKIPGATVSVQHLDCSLSHVEELAVATISDKEKEGLVGVDMEKIQPFSPAVKTAFLTSREQAYVALRETDEQLLETLFWTVKEAYLKAIGQGLRQHPATVEVTFSASQQISSVTNNGFAQPIEAKWSILNKQYIMTQIYVKQPAYEPNSF